MIPRAPSQHGRSVLSPPYSELAALLRANWHRRDDMRSAAGIVSLPSSAAARADLLTRAVDFTAAYRHVQLPAAPQDRPLIMVGHQPQLFHPGVWFKNFVLHRLAQELDAIAVHVIVDNDLCRRAAVTTPSGSPAKPILVQVDLDHEAATVPYEERTIVDAIRFESFPNRLEAALEAYPFQPLVRQIWPAAMAAVASTNRLGLALARARHQLEQQWGLRTIEVPLSQICGSPAFAAFCIDLAFRMEQTHQSYNEELQRFRHANRIRSEMHPVPALHQSDTWWELPFWCWTKTNPTRRPLYVRRKGREMQWSNLHGDTWDFSSHEDLGAAVEQLQHWGEQGLKIRPRALTTTLYLRLVLCDLFIHGIGGGSYDRLTDAWMTRLYAVAPPPYLTTTATLLLPGWENLTAQDDLRSIARKLRDFEYHPETYLDGNLSAASLVRQKQDAVNPSVLVPDKRAWHVRVAGLNEQLRRLMPNVRTRLEQRRTEVEEMVRHETLLGSREFSFCLFPAAELRESLAAMTTAACWVDQAAMIGSGSGSGSRGPQQRRTKTY